MDKIDKLRRDEIRRLRRSQVIVLALMTVAGAATIVAGGLGWLVVVGLCGVSALHDEWLVERVRVMPDHLLVRYASRMRSRP